MAILVIPILPCPRTQGQKEMIQSSASSIIHLPWSCIKLIYLPHSGSTPKKLPNIHSKSFVTQGTKPRSRLGASTMHKSPDVNKDTKFFLKIWVSMAEKISKGLGGKKTEISKRMKNIPNKIKSGSMLWERRVVIVNSSFSSQTRIHFIQEAFLPWGQVSMRWEQNWGENWILLLYSFPYLQHLSPSLNL